MVTTPLTILVIYGFGFIWFLRLASESPDLPQRADAIVVLTGGPERIGTGLRLLMAGHAANLLISGLGSGATLQDVAHRAGVEPGTLPVPLIERITLGRQATTTRTNAIETAQFVRTHAIHDLIVVTAGYHMPRALLELRRAMPEVVLHPAPVQPGRAAARTPTWRLLLEEYSKWLVVTAGLSGFAPGYSSRANPAQDIAPVKSSGHMLHNRSAS